MGFAGEVSVIFENLAYGVSMEEIIENYAVTRKQIQSRYDNRPCPRKPSRPFRAGPG